SCRRQGSAGRRRRRRLRFHLRWATAVLGSNPSSHHRGGRSCASLGGRLLSILSCGGLSFDRRLLGALLCSRRTDLHPSVEAAWSLCGAPSIRRHLRPEDSDLYAARDSDGPHRHVDRGSSFDAKPRQTRPLVRPTPLGSTPPGRPAEVSFYSPIGFSTVVLILVVVGWVESSQPIPMR